MVEPLIISISGLRGIAGDNLTAAIAADYARAFGTYLRRIRPAKDKNPSVCIGRDTRPSGQMLMGAAIEGLRTAGVDVIDL